MASYPSWGKLNKRQRRMAMDRYRDRQKTAKQTPAADRNPLYNPTVTLSGRDLKRSVNQIIRGQYRPVENALTRQAKTATTQNERLASRVAGYSDTVDKRADVTTARQEAIAERLGQQLAAIGQQQQATADRVQSEEGARRDLEPALQAAPAGIENPVAEEIAALRARAAADAGAMGNQGAVLGANYASLSNSNREALALRGQEQQGDIATRLANELAEVRAKRADLQTQKGADRTKMLLDLRQSGFENLVTTQGLGLKQAELQADIEEQRKAQSLARRKQREAERNNAFGRQDRAEDNARENAKFESAMEQDAYQRENQLGPYKPMSPKKESAAAAALKTDILNGVAMFKDLLGSKDKQGNTRSIDRVQEILRRRGAAPIAVLAMADLAQYGYVRPAHLKSLRIAGVDIPGSWRRPKGKKGKRKPKVDPESPIEIVNGW